MKAKLLTPLLAFSFLAAQAAPIRDVPSSHWAQSEVNTLVNDYGFMKGDPNGYFGGNRALTRYEFAKTISRLIEYYNAEIDSDRKDIENMVSIMELFQNELKVLEDKLSTVSKTVEEQNQVIGEINELAVAIGEEYQAEGNSPKEVIDARVTKLEYDIDKLQDKGLIVDTLVKGTFNDIKKLGRATARVVSGTRKNIRGPKVTNPEPVELTEYIPPTGQAQSYINEVQQQTRTTVQQEPSMYNPYDVEIMEDLGQ